MKSDQPLHGKVAVVTGAARGLGLGYARRLADRGANIAICDLNLESAHEYQAEADNLVDGSLEATLASYGVEYLLQQVDVTDPSALQKFANSVQERWGRADVLICNAGGGGDFSRNLPTDLDLDGVQSTFERNLFSVFNTVKAFGPMMQQRQSGKIITVSSFTGMTVLGDGHGSDYATAKSAVSFYTRYLAQELGPHGVTANAIAPGFIATGQFSERLGAADPERLETWRSMAALRRLGTPEDVINVVDFLAGPGSDFITGQTICVDGGIVRGAS
ncbi:SDR family oxidoreductase [Arthrobacter sp. I2-34]|uniref:SDR family oxidoreductase n=1 Tax=Arthrobacter hankyongi TaxID=2904801 RepID=A0ABS9LDL3_9MICC|nr:SDR family oxidoreductase [Arthrobacter hankyongi]MCG2624718.1 SDR family oxidoreductase [Arthrobacter hankyongi]